MPSTSTMDDTRTDGATPRDTAERNGTFTKRFLVLLFVSAVLLHAAGLNGKWRFQRDSAIYLSLARSMVEGRGYVHNGEFHTRYSPGLPATLAAVGSATGMPEMPWDSFLPFNVVGAVAGLGCVAFMVLIIRELGLGWIQATVPVVLLTFSRTRYYYSVHIMTDVPFVCLALGALWCGLRMRRSQGARSWAWCGGAALFAAAASMFRPVGPLLVPALAAGMWLHRDALRGWLPRAGKTLLILLLVAAPIVAWSVYTQAKAPEAEVGYARNKLAPEQLVRRSAGLVTRWLEHPEGFADAVLGSNFGTITGLVLMGVMAVGLVVSVRRGERMLSVFALLCMAAIVCGGWAIRRRYLLPALPVMLYWLVLGGTAIGGWLQRTDFWTAPRLRRLGWACVVCIMAVNVIRIGDLVWQNNSTDFYQRVEGGVVA
ncbi:MAG: glycosyltransferase family 39 protein, partial [Candidatus Brocadiia bacterium]